MAAAVTAAVSFPSTKSTSLPSRTFIVAPDRVAFNKKVCCTDTCLQEATENWDYKYFITVFGLLDLSLSQVPLQYRDVCSSGRLVSIRAQVTTEAPAKVEKESKKQEEGLVVNKFKPKNPYVGRCLLNTKITGDDAPGETWHMVFSTEGGTSCIPPPPNFLLVFPPFTIHT